LIAFTVIIPARMASERLAGKPLCDLGGRTMIERVQEQAWGSGATRVVVATEDEQVASVARAAGGEAVITRCDHATGTDRIAEVTDRLALTDDAIVVNLQGDEPLMPPVLLRAAAEDLAQHPNASIATLATPLDSHAVQDPNYVKVVCDAHGYALYFSRAPIPWPREEGGAEPGSSPWRRHLGIYAYRAGFLRCFPGLEVPRIESLERLEQLRALWHGHPIHIATVNTSPEPGVDTPADLERVAAYFQG